MQGLPLAGRRGQVDGRRQYRLIDGCCEPHRQLDGLYSSLDEAFSEAIAWLQAVHIDPLMSLIGVEVTAANGDWRTLRLPESLLCPLLCPLPA
jgi:hypothetical protein